MVLKKLIKKSVKKVAPKKRKTKAERQVSRYKKLGEPLTHPERRKKSHDAKIKSGMYTKVPNKYFDDELKYDRMISSGKKLSDAQLKAYSKAVKVTSIPFKNKHYLNNDTYVTRGTMDTTPGTKKHALETIKRFSEYGFLKIPKKYLDLYKRKKGKK